jgi:hypothetical protein
VPAVTRGDENHSVIPPSRTARRCSSRRASAACASESSWFGWMSAELRLCPRCSSSTSLRAARRSDVAVRAGARRHRRARRRRPRLAGERPRVRRDRGVQDGDGHRVERQRDRVRRLDHRPLRSRTSLRARCSFVTKNLPPSLRGLRDRRHATQERQDRELLRPARPPGSRARRTGPSRSTAAARRAPRRPRCRRRREHAVGEEPLLGEPRDVARDPRRV